MDPLYNNNPNPNPAPAPRPTPGNAMPNIAEAPAHSAPAPAPVSNQMPNMASSIPTPVMEEVPTPTMSFEQAFQNPNASNNAFSVGATEPVIEPNVPPVDPIAEELAKPIKAAAPVPGSIGSAVSMPEAPAPAPTPAPAPIPEAPVMPEPIEAPTPVAPEPAPSSDPFSSELPDDIEAFLNDEPAAQPAVQPADIGASVPTTPNNNIAFDAQPVSPYSSEDSFEMTNTKKSFLPKFDDKNKLKFILIAGGALLAIILIVVIVLMMLPKGSSSSDQPVEPVVVNDPTIDKTLTCKRDFTEVDLIDYSEASEGNESVEVGFGEDGAVMSYEQTIELTYADIPSAKAAEAKIKTDREAEIAAYGLEIDPFTSSYGSQDSKLYLTRHATPEEYNIENFLYYGLDMKVDIDSWQNSYETDGFTCSVK